MTKSKAKDEAKEPAPAVDDFPKSETEQAPPRPIRKGGAYIDGKPAKGDKGA